MNDKGTKEIPALNPMRLKMVKARSNQKKGLDADLKVLMKFNDESYECPKCNTLLLDFHIDGTILCGNCKESLNRNEIGANSPKCYFCDVQALKFQPDGMVVCNICKERYKYLKRYSYQEIVLMRSSVKNNPEYLVICSVTSFILMYFFLGIGLSLSGGSTGPIMSIFSFIGAVGFLYITYSTRQVNELFEKILKEYDSLEELRTKKMETRLIKSKHRAKKPHTPDPGELTVTYASSVKDYEHTDENWESDRAEFRTAASIKGYGIGRVVRRGPMSIDYRATNKSDGKPVNIRRLKKKRSLSLKGDQRRQMEILTEMRVWFLLSRDAEISRGIAEVYAYGKYPHPWVAMEPLNDKLEKRSPSMTMDQKRKLGVHILATLAKVHVKGVTHGELEPKRIMVNDQGEWKITDWALRKVSTQKDGSIKGSSMCYVAPEQLDPKRYGGITIQTDIYRAGGVLYWIFTGEHPFHGSCANMLKNIKAGKLRTPKELNPEIPDNISRAIMKALRGKKSQRWQYVHDFMRELRK